MRCTSHIAIRDRAGGWCGSVGAWVRGIAGWRGGRGGVEARGVAMRHEPLRDGWRGNASQSAHVRENAAQARVSSVYIPSHPCPLTPSSYPLAQNSPGKQISAPEKCCFWYNIHCQNGNVTGLRAPRREPPRRGRQDRPSVANRSSENLDISTLTHGLQDGTLLTIWGVALPLQFSGPSKAFRSA